MKSLLKIKGLHASVGRKEILRGVDLDVPAGEIHAVMGPNGSGKSTLAHVVMGNPRYQVTAGSLIFAGQDLMGKSPDERARMGLFLSFQYPVPLPGIPLDQLVRRAAAAVAPSAPADLSEFLARLEDVGKAVELPAGLLGRPSSEGFSGGEKKKAEVIQMTMLEPKFVILDEVDSGLDIDALGRVASAVEAMRSAQRSFLIITHYQRILSLVRPDVVHVMKDGRMVRSGGPELVEELEKTGYVDVEAA